MQLHLLKKHLRIHVFHLLVVRTHSAWSKEKLLAVLVYQTLTEYLLTVDQNALLTANVPAIKPVTIKNVEIHALVLVLQMPNVTSLVILRDALAWPGILAIHQFSVSFLVSQLKNLNLHACLCIINYKGAIVLFVSVESTPIEHTSPCTPSPCGANAVCKEQNHAGSCSCLPEYFGNPYEGCRPECIVNSDCPTNRACFNSKCTDPCPGTCGTNAVCQVVSHIPRCSCLPSYTGDPFRYCSIIPTKPGNILHLKF